MGLTTYDKLNMEKIPFNRTIGYRTINGYKVRSTKRNEDDRLVADKLHQLQLKVNNMIQKNLVMGELRKIKEINKIISKEKNRWILEGLKLLQSTHFRKPGGLAEIESGIGFRGMNYPMGVNETNKFPISRDGSLRANSRLIYLTIRNTSEESINNTLIHELAHTLSNDVIYYAKHTQDFYLAEKVIKHMWVKCGNNKK